MNEILVRELQPLSIKIITEYHGKRIEDTWSRGDNPPAFFGESRFDVGSKFIENEPNPFTNGINIYLSPFCDKRHIGYWPISLSFDEYVKDLEKAVADSTYTLTIRVIVLLLHGHQPDPAYNPDCAKCPKKELCIGLLWLGILTHAEVSFSPEELKAALNS